MKLTIFTWLGSMMVIVGFAINVVVGAVASTDPAAPVIGDGGIAAITGAIGGLVVATWKVSALYAKVQENLTSITSKLETLEKACRICRNHDPKD